LAEGDKVAVAQFATAYLEPLAVWLESNNPSADPHLCREAAEDTILAVLKNPSAYDPDRLEPIAYLRMASRRDLLNALARAKRQRRRQKRWSAVELSPEAGKYFGRDDDPSLPLQIAEGTAGALSPADAGLRASLDGPEREVFDLMLQGVRDTGEYAKALGLSDRTDEDQRRAVKRVKDKIQKRRQRAGGGREQPP
jgi:DNA-directed RNA polymerase specialized sigma24 family protein